MTHKKDFCCMYCLLPMKNILAHITQCSKGPRGEKALLEAYIYYYGLSVESVIKDFVNGMTGSDICKKYNIKHSILNIILKVHEIPKRSWYESNLIGAEKCKKTKMEKYGNPYYADIDKRRKTLKKRYGSDGYNNLEKRRETCLKVFGVDNASKNPHCVEKANKTKKERGIPHKVSMLQKGLWSDPIYRSVIVKKQKEGVVSKYGVDNVAKVTAIYDRIKRSIEARFGVKNISQSDYMRKIMVEKGLWISDTQKSSWELYLRNVRRITRKYVSHLFNAWKFTGGLCYYTQIPLIDAAGNVIDKLHAPSVDHKVSIVHGFLNGVSAEIIGGVENLCICSLSVNSYKRGMTEKEYLGSDKELKYLKSDKASKSLKKLFMKF